MRSWRELFARWHPSKWKVAGFVGFVVGIALCISLSTTDGEARGQEFSPLSQSINQLQLQWPELFPATHSTQPTSASATRQPNAVTPEEPVDMEPDVFLDRTIARAVAPIPEQKTPEARIALDHGESIEFSIDPALQEGIDKLFLDYHPVAGAFVAMNPKTGEILAMSGYDDGALAPHIALRSIGPAASIFKIITAAALLEEADVDPRQSVCYHGGRRGVSMKLLKPNPSRDNRCDTIGQAMGKSANVVFARLADQNLSKRTLQDVADRFAFNEVIPFFWPVDISRAAIPDDRLERAQTAAGFHNSRMSALHAALIASTIANKGKMPRPTIVRSVSAKDGANVYRHVPDTLNKVISARTARDITQMMRKTIDGGTATRYFRRLPSRFKDVPIAGKTGSLSFKRENGQTVHCSWFVGFAPADNPQIAVASVVLNEPKWTVKATTLGRFAIQNFLETRPLQGIAKNP